MKTRIIECVPNFSEGRDKAKIKEITDAMAATQAYSANVTAFSTLKTVIARGLELGK